MIEKRLFKFCGNTKKYIGHAVLMSCLRLLANIAFNYMLAYLLTSLLQGKTMISLGRIILMILPIFLIRQWTIRMVARKNQKVVSEVKHNLRKEVFGKVLRLGSSYQESLTTQEIIHLGVEGVEQLENYYGAYLTQFYYCFASAVILLLSLLPFSPKVAIVLFVLSPIIPILLQLMMKMVKRVQKDYWNSYADVGNLFLDSLQGLTTLKIFRADKRKADEMEEITENFRIYTMKLLAMQLNSMTIIDWFAYGGAAAGIIIALNQYNKGIISLFGVILVILLAAEFFVPMRTLTSLFHVAMTGVTAGDRMLEFLEKEEPVRNGIKKLGKNPSLMIKNLDYTYADGTKALDTVHMEIKPGQMTAIVGPSGCGKSTLASILSGQYPVEKNSIFLDQVEINEIDIRDLTSQIIRITHNGHLFIGTVRDNLKMGNEAATDKQMIKALKTVRMWEFLKTQNGLDTTILSGGVNLSGGQAQRISLARALLHDSQIYIFDEATSNIDVESEEVILQVIEKLAKQKTVVYISHRLQSVKQADQIYVMEHGKVIQSGTHEQLIAEKGLYQSLFMEQEALESYRKKHIYAEEAANL